MMGDDDDDDDYDEDDDDDNDSDGDDDDGDDETLWTNWERRVHENFLKISRSSKRSKFLAAVATTEGREAYLKAVKEEEASVRRAFEADHKVDELRHQQELAQLRDDTLAAVANVASQAEMSLRDLDKQLAEKREARRAASRDRLKEAKRERQKAFDEKWGINLSERPAVGAERWERRSSSPAAGHGRSPRSPPRAPAGERRSASPAGERRSASPKRAAAPRTSAPLRLESHAAFNDAWAALERKVRSGARLSLSDIPRPVSSEVLTGIARYDDRKQQKKKLWAALKRWHPDKGNQWEPILTQIREEDRTQAEQLSTEMAVMIIQEKERLGI
mmetsp:Transcript_13504/g.23491  ORF Transcript_13504/g.23491 Transcript_13504/m.23491 type:complete len:332 (-) Transcript_13504:96-1091(-)